MSRAEITRIKLPEARRVKGDVKQSARIGRTKGMITRLLTRAPWKIQGALYISSQFCGGDTETKTLEYWQDDGWYVGRLQEIPGVFIFSQGETMEELKANIEDAYELMMEGKSWVYHQRESLCRRYLFCWGGAFSSMQMKEMSWCMCIAEKVRGNTSIGLMRIILTYENLILIIYRWAIRNK